MFAPAMILHADADAFFASVEQRDDPRLRGRPTIVGPGVVMAASYEAKACGVLSAMGTKQALRLCPHAVVVTPRFDAYVAASKALFAIFRETSPVVEGLSLEEAFLDVAGLERISGSPREIALRLRREVRDEVGLAVSVGLATTKAVAKMASSAAKPDGLLLVERGREFEFLHPLPVEAVWGVGRSTAERLRRHGLRTVGELAAAGPDALAAMVGRHRGHHLYAVATNRDPRPVRRGRRRRSIGSQSASIRPSSSPAEVDATLVALVDRVTRRLRSKGRVGRTVVLRMRFGDFARATRSRTLSQATAATVPILAIARGLLAAARPLYAERGLTLVGVTISNLGPAEGGVQLELPIERRRAAIDDAVDEIRERFGADAVTRGALVRAGRDLEASLLAGEKAASERQRERL